MIFFLAAHAAPPLQLERIERLPEGGVRLRQASGPIVESGGFVVLSLDGTVPAEVRQQGRSLGSDHSWRVPVRPGEDALEAAQRWNEHPSVRSAYPDITMEIRSFSYDDPSFGAQWYLESVGHEAMMAITEGSPDIRIAVIDSAIDITHPDLEPAVVEPFDALVGDDDPNVIPGEGCDAGDTEGLCETHGTAVASIAMARGNNGSGIVGMCPQCTLIPIRLIANDGSGTLANNIAAFEHALAANAAVINNSWGYTQPYEVPQPFVDMITRARTESRGGLGAVVVFAAGNDDRRLQDWELNGFPEILTVSAYDRYGFQTNYTNRGAIDLSAPSATVACAPGGGVTNNFGGTSAAAPVVSGILGWALSIDPTIDEERLRAMAIETSDPITADGERHNVLGWGRIDPIALHALITDDGEEDVEEPKGCGCASSRPILGLSLLPLLVGWRRRSTTRQVDR